MDKKNEDKSDVRNDKIRVFYFEHQYTGFTLWKKLSILSENCTKKQNNSDPCISNSFITDKIFKGPALNFKNLGYYFTEIIRHNDN